VGLSAKWSTLWIGYFKWCRVRSSECSSNNIGGFLIMPMNFPDTPTNGATFTSGGSTWTWFTTPGAWKAATASGGVANLYLPLTGGQLSGPLTISQNTGTPVALPAGGATLLWLVGPDNAAYPRLMFDAYGTGSVPIIEGRSARGTLAAPTSLQAGDLLFGLRMTGWGGTAYGTNNRASMYWSTTENWTAAAQGSQMVFNTTVTGSTTGTNSLVLTSSYAVFWGGLRLSGNAINVASMTWAQLNAAFGTLANSGSLAVGWNYSGGGGETTFFINRSAGNGGGLTIYDFPNASGTPAQLLSVGTGTNGVNIYRDSNAALVIGNAAGTGNFLKIAGNNVTDNNYPGIRSDGNNLVLNPKTGGEVYLSYDVTSGFVCVGSTTNNVNDPLEIHTPTTNYCRVRYYTSRTWSAGPFPSGTSAGPVFGIADESGAKVEWWFGYNGQWHQTFEHIMAGSDNLYWCGWNGGHAWIGCSAYQYPNPSDASLKTDFADLPTCLDIVQALTPQRYRYHSAPNEEKHRVHWGFIAQDVEAVMTQRGHDFSGGHRIDRGIHALDYTRLIAVLWKAVQELTEEVASLKKGMA
jgi:hypothetical protein